MNNENFLDAYRVNNVLIKPREHIIECGADSTPISPRALKILKCLIQSEGELVTYEEIVREAWNGSCSENALHKQMANLRKALNDSSTNPKIIKTVPRQGYQFVGEVEFIQKETSESKKAPQKSKTFAIAGIAACVFVLAVFTFFTTTNINNNADDKNHYKSTFLTLNNNEDYPTTFVAIEGFSYRSGNTQSSSSGTLTTIIKYHLDRVNQLHASLVPIHSGLNYYSKLADHIAGFAQIDYALRPFSTQNEDTTTLGLIRIDTKTLTENNVFSIESPTENLADAIAQFEQAFITFLKSEKLTSQYHTAQLSSTSSNEWLLKSTKNLFNKSQKLNDLTDAIAASKKAIEANPKNLIAYTVFWDSTFSILEHHTYYDVNDTLSALKEFSEKAITQDPAYYKSHIALAEYYCWIKSYDMCSQSLTTAIAENPYDPHVHNAITWNMILLGLAPNKIAKKSYFLNPHHINTATLYRNALLSDRDFYTSAQLGIYHSDWEGTPSNWYFISQSKTRYEDLQFLSHWYRHNKDNPLNNAVASIPSKNYTTHIAEDAPPSRYIGYALLNANRPLLAQNWANYGGKQEPLYFDLRSINLLSDIWRGKWDPLKWQTIRNFAMDRKEHQNNLDKLYIAYFDFQAGLYNQASQLLLEVFPELNSPDLVIDENNLRFAMYFAEIDRRNGQHKAAQVINNSIKTYLQESRIVEARNSYLGLADVEFYALNNDKKRAIEALKQAIYEQHWLPNAFWLWPPLEHNIFLASLKGDSEFEKLVERQNSELAKLCFDENCADQQGFTSNN